jgi:hypothetical protein
MEQIDEILSDGDGSIEQQTQCDGKIVLKM